MYLEAVKKCMLTKGWFYVQQITGGGKKQNSRADIDMQAIYELQYVAAFKSLVLKHDIATMYRIYLETV